MIEWTAASAERALRAAIRAQRLLEAGEGECVEDDDLAAVANVIGWLAKLDDIDAEIVRLRCSGSPWKPICWRLGIGRATAHRRWKAALRRIADRLGDIAPSVDSV